MFVFIEKIFNRLLTGVVVNASTHTKCVFLSNHQNSKINLLLSIYIPMNTVNNYSTTYLQLN